MNAVFPFRIVLDLLALGLLIACLAYWWLDNLAHELIGTSFFALLIAHNVFNRRWYGALPKMKQDASRITYSVIILCMAVSGTVMLITSLLISRDMFSITSISRAVTPQTIHMFTGYWMLVFVGIHLGTRWQTVMGMCRSTLGLAEAGAVRRWVFRFLAIAVAVKGLLSITEMGLGAKLMWSYALDMWDFNADASGFFVNYLSIVGLCAVVAHYAMTLLRKRRRREHLSA